ncbi:hypothetical protein FRB96_007618 [Tulasnella sp. 330]|nr:hypothetical protein FRB96_007618 [Tulasnella sp. 330]KAG8880063.1 hypothetical protein FRB97_001108 [Tulasnella sp. 331]KAG8886695.1 hypothetical protein FRB98_001099 [Tulasnella sp. 332]
MTSSTPDISQLAISDLQGVQEYDAFNDHGQLSKTFHHLPNSVPPASLNQQFQYQPVTMGQQGMKKPTRAGLPSHWLDNNNAQNAQGDRPHSPQNGSDLSTSTNSPPQVPQIQPPQLYGGQTASTTSADDEIIPTAIVIKNIPFTVRRETLLDIIASLNIPTPYAFNYHIDGQGQFRGLAFANFRMPQDADAVVAALNGFDVQGRKLRVEYKKVLLPPEKERIEREKALRRMRSMQLDKERDAYQRGGIGGSDWDEFGPVQMPAMSAPSPIGPPVSSFGGGMGGMSPPPSMPPMSASSSPTALRSYGPNGMGMGMPSSQSQPSLGLPRMSIPGPQAPPPPSSYPSPPPPSTPAKSSNNSSHELDMNDPATLDIYSRILVFKEDHMRDELAFSRSLSPKQRRIVHLVAQRLGVYHYSVGEGEDRYAVVTRIPREDAPRQPTLRIPSGDPAPRTMRTTKNLHRSPSGYLQGPPPAASHAAELQTNQDNQATLIPPSRGLHTRPSMPNLNSIHQYQRGQQAQLDSGGINRLSSRPSNGSLHDRYATVGPSPRRPRDNFGLFNGNGNSGDSSIPPVPTLPSIPALNGETGVVRQPRGPGVGGFARRPTAEGRPSGNGAVTTHGGLDIRSHEDLEI